MSVPVEALGNADRSNCSSPRLLRSTRTRTARPQFAFAADALTEVSAITGALTAAARTGTRPANASPITIGLERDDIVVSLLFLIVEENLPYDLAHE
jgi:hypothetical protein